MENSTLVIWLGWIGTILTSIYLLPQSLKVIFTKKTNDLSLYMLILSQSSTIVWAVYGLLFNPTQWNIFVTNVIHGSLVFIILIFKIMSIMKNKERKKVAKK